MAGTIGQIIYNVDGIYMEEENKIKLKKKLTEDGIIGSIIPAKNVITKLGIQAQPGLKILLSTYGGQNDTEIIIGRSGIYELDERIKVSQLKISPTPKYQYNEEETKKAQDEALKRFNQIQDFSGADKNKNKTLEWEETENFVKIYQGNNILFDEGYPFYLQGKNGVYSPIMNDKNEIQREEIYNLIIDYIYESIG